MRILVIVSGASAAGQTTMLGKLERRYGNGRVVTITTRAKRSGEADDAYHFFSRRELAAMESRQETLWVIERYGNQYSVTGQAIWGSLLENAGIAFLAITPDCHVRLATWCKENDVIPLNAHLAAPGKHDQQDRLQQRDGADFDQKRVKERDIIESQAAEAAEKIDMLVLAQGKPEDMFLELCQKIDLLNAPG